MPSYVYGILVVAWAVWVTPFLLVRRGGDQAKKIDKRARLGVLITAVGYTLLWQGKFWLRSPQLWQTALSVLLFAIAAYVSWSASRVLGRQWRIDAGLSAGHELVMAGPYRFVRHPIYTSMFAMLLGTGVLITPWQLFIPAILLFVIGTEIRVRIEDALLASQFGEKFAAYERKVPAYAPFFR